MSEQAPSGQTARNILGGLSQARSPRRSALVRVVEDIVEPEIQSEIASVGPPLDAPFTAREKFTRAFNPATEVPAEGLIVAIDIEVTASSRFQKVPWEGAQEDPVEIQELALQHAEQVTVKKFFANIKW